MGVSREDPRDELRYSMEKVIFQLYCQWMGHEQKIVGLQEEEITMHYACSLVKVFVTSNKVMLIILLAYVIKSKCELDVLILFEV